MQHPSTSLRLRLITSFIIHDIGGDLCDGAHY